MSKDNFKFYVPAEILKASNPKTGKEEMRIKGIASTTSKDSQGEMLDPTGFDLSSFKWLNWNHLGKDDPSKILGEPTVAKITPQKEMYIEGILYPEVEAAKSTFQLMKALQNSPNGNKLSLSVEGKVTERDPLNPKKVKKARITAVAICPTPVNGDAWTDVLTKGVREDMNEERYDDDVIKVIEKAEKEMVKEPLLKSEIYDRILSKYPGISSEKATSVYNLILKVATMEKSADKTVSEETLKKSLAILDLASEEIAKAEKEGKEDDDNDKDEDDLKKEVKKAENKKAEEEDEEDKDMTEKAYGHVKEMKKSGMKKEEAKEKLIKKGYGEKVVSKAIEKAEKDGEGWKQEGKNDKEEDTSTKEKEGVQKSFSELTDLIKSQGAAYDKKFKALGDLVNLQLNENAELKKSLDAVMEENAALKEDVSKALSQPGQRKSVVKSYSERFEKSEDGKQIYNWNSSQDRAALKNKLIDLSGLHKGEDFDKGLVKIAQDIELAKAISKSDLGKLADLDIKVVVA